MSAPRATSTTDLKPNLLIPSLIISGFTKGPNCPTKAGASMACTSSPFLIA